MKKRLLAALAAMVLATAAFAAKQKKPPKPKFPPYLEKFGSEVCGHTDDLPADLVIPDGVKNIWHDVFSRCGILKSVVIPESVKEIGERAFYRCTNLKSVTIGNGAKTLGKEAFYGCSNLRSMTIGSGIQTVGDGAFYGCTSLKKIEFGGTVAQWKASPISQQVNALSVRCSDGYIGLEDAPEYLVIDVRKNFVVVTGHTDAVPAKVVIPEGVTAIGQSAFYECNALESVTIPNSVKTIGWQAFYGCKSLASVTIPEGVTSIGNSAFRDCASLASVTIPNSVKTIERQAFYGCTSLASVTIPDSVTEIGDYAFEGCTSLKEVQFGGTKAQWKALKGSNGVKISFVRCSDGNIGVLGVPDYLKMNDTVVTGYKGTLPANVVIPEGVTAIAASAFWNCRSIASVTIPNSVKTIGEYAFSDCKSLKEIQFKGTMAQWEALKGSGGVKVPFVRCSDGNIGIENVPGYLEMDGTVVTGHTGTLPADIVIPEGVTAINERAFRNCESLKSVTIPSSVTTIGENALSGCTSLKEIQFKGTVAHWKAVKGSDGVHVPCVRCSDGHIGVENVPEYLKMYGTVVTGYAGTVPADLVIPEGVTAINERAFKGCESLKSVTIPGSVTEIGATAFENCNSLKSVTIPGSVAKIGACAFWNCTSLASVSIPEGVTSIGIGAFYNCKKLTSVTIPVSVAVISENDDRYNYKGAFENCTSLKEVQFCGTKAQWKTLKGSDGVKVPSVRCSDGHIGVENVPEYLKMYGMVVTGYAGTLPADLVIPEGVTGIDACAFADCVSLKSVTIPGSVTVISEDGDRYWYDYKGAFENCTSLVSVTIAEGVTEIDRRAFCGCTSLESVTIPGSVTGIGYNAFGDCKSLKKIEFGGTRAQWKAIERSDEVLAQCIRCSDGNIGVETVPEYLKMEFTETEWDSTERRYITKMIAKVTGYAGTLSAELVIPDGVTGIADGVFKNCSDIESVAIPGSVEEIGIKDENSYYYNGAFSECTYLERATIAEGVKIIGERAFKDCTALKDIAIPCSVTTIGEYAFNGCASLASVTIAEGVQKIGGNAFKDCKLLKSVSIPKSVTEIGYSVFEGCTSLASVTIPEGVQKINSRAFKGCTSLKSVTIPGSVTEICGESHYYGYGAFQDCTSLASVTIAEGVETIGQHAFRGCTSLTSVTIPRSVTTIDYYAFYGCKSLKSVAIPRGVTTIGTAAFNDCTSLASVVIPRSVTYIGSNAFYNCSPNLKIQYDGTKAQWNAIKKDSSGIGKFIVQCSDGTITN